MEDSMEGSKEPGPNSPCLGCFLLRVLLKGEVEGSLLIGEEKMGR